MRKVRSHKKGKKVYVGEGVMMRGRSYKKGVMRKGRSYDEGKELEERGVMRRINFFWSNN